MLGENAGASVGEEGEESFDELDLPVKLLEAEHETLGMHYKAKQRIAEIKKLRQFYRKPTDNEERKRAVAEKMKTNPCHTCGQLGHWSRECPMKAQAVLASSHTMKDVLRSPNGMKDVLSSSYGTKARRVNGQRESMLEIKDRDTAQYSQGAGVHGVCTTIDLALNDVLWSLQDLAFKVIVDLGCMKSVAGVNWVNLLLQRWQAEGQWFRVTNESEAFKFGDGQVLMSKYRVEFVGSFAGKPVVYGFSVVEGCCPPLFSRSGCTDLGAVIDCALHTISSRKLKVKSYGLGQESGHYRLSVDGVPDRPSLPHDSQLASCVDVAPLCSEVLRSQETPPPIARFDDNQPHGRGNRASSMSTVLREPPDQGLPVDHRGVRRQLPEGGDDRRGPGRGDEGPQGCPTAPDVGLEEPSDEYDGRDRHHWKPRD